IPLHSMEEEWDVAGLVQRLESDFNLKLNLQQWLDKDKSLDEDKLRERIISAFNEAYQAKEAQIDEKVMRQFEKAVMLQMLDTSWREHLAAMDYLRQGIHLRGYAQKNPKQEYKREAFELFALLLNKINYEVISALSKFEVRVEQDVEQIAEQRRQTLNLQQVEYQHAALNTIQDTETAVGQEEQAVSSTETFVRGAPKIGRNVVCPCGSGKKYKQCHGKFD
ncbi:MAG: SEC-C domain-containing protein, partial [Gammaproteobacteria bacterium]|nr:SEC-C domain-containing protein [Gammaproteobacteria bacterium]